jgi:prepilin-type processing-associated H-X9-DG protein
LLFCPSDPGSHIDDNSLAGIFQATTSYGTCVGDWYVFSVNWGSTNTMGPMNRSIFGPSYPRTIAVVTDGLSNTSMTSEGYIGHAQMRSCIPSPTPPSDPTTWTWTPNDVPAPGPASAAALLHLASNCGARTGRVKAGGPHGHTRWCNGGVYDSGFTTAMTPNHGVSVVSRATGFSRGGKRVHIDWDSTDENDGGPTYMSLAATSYHSGGVNAQFADGSLRFIKNTVGPTAYRVLGTIAGGEVISADAY